MDIIHDVRRRWSARRWYRRYHAEAAELFRRLYEIDGAAVRAEALYLLADRHMGLSIMRPAAYGTDPITESLSSSSRLLRLAAATERMLVVPEVASRELEDELYDVPAAEAGAWRVLGLTPDRSERAQSIERIATLAAARVGGQATESLYSIAASERELAAASAAGRVPIPPARLPSRWQLTVFFTAVAGMIAWPMLPGVNTWPLAAQAAAFFAGLGLPAVLSVWIWLRPRRPVRRGRRGD